MEICLAAVKVLLRENIDVILNEVKNPPASASLSDRSLSEVEGKLRGILQSQAPSGRHNNNTQRINHATTNQHHHLSSITRN
jgi:hypothetical protein